MFCWLEIGSKSTDTYILWFPRSKQIYCTSPYPPTYKPPDKLWSTTCDKLVKQLFFLRISGQIPIKRSPVIYIIWHLRLLLLCEQVLFKHCNHLECWLKLCKGESLKLSCIAVSWVRSSTWKTSRMFNTKVSWTQTWALSILSFSQFHAGVYQNILVAVTRETRDGVSIKCSLLRLASGSSEQMRNRWWRRGFVCHKRWLMRRLLQEKKLPVTLRICYLIYTRPGSRRRWTMACISCFSRLCRQSNGEKKEKAMVFESK